jgi:hypothetical protein
MPHCDVRFTRCRIHHITPWLPTGPTDLDNLIPVCTHHHHQLHEGGWTLTMTPDRVITVHTPNGTPHHHGTTTNRHTTNPDVSDHQPTDHQPIDHRDHQVTDHQPIDHQLLTATRTRIAELTRRRCRTTPRHGP